MKLDKSKPFGTCVGHAGAIYEQGGVLFDVNGDPVEAKATAKAATKAPAAQVQPDAADQTPEVTPTPDGSVPHKIVEGAAPEAAAPAKPAKAAKEGGDKQPGKPGRKPKAGGTDQLSKQLGG